MARGEHAERSAGGSNGRQLDAAAPSLNPCSSDAVEIKNGWLDRSAASNISPAATLDPSHPQVSWVLLRVGPGIARYLTG